ncbi:ribonuclease III [Chromatium okenii]|uniref:Ribonuclease 3 n=1 Tax=Chromatium okenii TaxID=61644 RepID=A0A2S7XP44_9GAMM|nr:ribonuclease III [Chromatium okenii]PQJ95514.1 ribonuclease III [Chromatium okenii]
MNAEPRRLALILGYSFQSIELFEQALTHRSAGTLNNERLEFLGDALIGFLIAEVLSEKFPDANEGTLSRMRASLVKRESLAELARKLKLGDYLRLGAGELRTGGHARDSILADALEAVLGAIYLDGGFTAARQVVLALFADRLNATSATQSGKDPKTQLQEWLQSRRRALPEYVVVTVAGDQHNQSFTVRCQLSDALIYSLGTGSSRRRAEQSAAELMLEQIKI